MTRSARPAFTFVEVLAAVVVVTALMLITTQMLVLVARYTRVNQQRLAAIEAAASTMEIVTAQPYAQLDSQLLERQPVQVLLQPIGEGWEMELTVEPVDEPAVGKRIRLAVVHSQSAPTNTPIVLTAWRFGKN